MGFLAEKYMKKTILIIVGILVIGGIIGGGFWYWQKKKSINNSNVPKTQNEIAIPQIQTVQRKDVLYKNGNDLVLYNTETKEKKISKKKSK